MKCEHIEVIDKAVAPTCTKTGLTEGKHCLLCNKILKAQQAVDVIEHSYGYDSVCDVCGYVTFIKAESIALSESSLDLQIGENKYIKTTIKPDNATDKTV